MGVRPLLHAVGPAAVTAPAPRVALYARVSTLDQDVRAQLDRLQLSGPVMDYHTTPVEFADDGVSGRLESRPSFDRLREVIRSDGVDVVVAEKLDRIGRSARGILAFFDECEQHHVRVVLTNQAIDTATSAGKMVRTILASVAEFERDLAVERTQATMDAFKAGTRVPRGPVGRPRVLTDDKIARIRELRYGQGLPWKTVAQYTGICAVTARKVKPAPPTSTPRVLNE